MSISEIFPVSTFLEKYGWNYTYDGENWFSGWQGEERFYPFKISTSDTFVFFEVLPFFHLSDSLIWQESEIHQLIMEWNRDIQIFKVILTEEGHLGIVGQFFREGWSYDLFTQGIGVLAYYCEELSKQLGEHVGKEEKIENFLYQ